MPITQDQWQEMRATRAQRMAEQRRADRLDRNNNPEKYAHEYECEAEAQELNDIAALGVDYD